MIRISLILPYLKMLRFRNSIVVLILVVCGITHINGQGILKDSELIENHITNLDQHHSHNHDIVFLLSDHPSPFVRYNPVSLALGSIMWTYQRIISPQFSASCLYSPSCSNYSKNLISDFGIFRGIILTADRLTRCNRLALMDFKVWEVDSRIGKIRESTELYRINE